ncbi:MAG: cell division protein FtsA [Armatimonadetes bacterium]|nr:cell division protein FtsA [Armatimonadota bacterium]
MARSEIIVGLDIGTTKVCAVVGEVSKDGVALAGHGLVPCEGLRKGIVVDIRATAEAVADAVAQAEKMTGYQIRSVAVGVTGQHVASCNREASVPIQKFRDIAEEDVAQVLEAAERGVAADGREVIHNIPRLFSIDGHAGIRRPVGMSGSSLEVESHVITAQSSQIQNVIKCVHEADLSIVPHGIILEPLATARAVLTPDERELGVALVDIGGGTSDVALFRLGTVFHSAVIAVGGNHVTNDLAVGLRVARGEAERIKLAHGTALEESVDEAEAVAITPVGQPEGDGTRVPRRIIGEIVQPRMEELFELVQAEIERAGAAGQLPAGLVLSGGGSRLPGTLAVAARVLGVPVRLGTPLDPAAATGSLNGPEFATGVGLVLYAASTYRAGDLRNSSLVRALWLRLRHALRRVFS